MCRTIKKWLIELLGVVAVQGLAMMNIDIHLHFDVEFHVSIDISLVVWSFFLSRWNSYRVIWPYHIGRSKFMKWALTFRKGYTLSWLFLFAAINIGLSVSMVDENTDETKSLNSLASDISPLFKGSLAQDILLIETSNNIDEEHLSKAETNLNRFVSFVSSLPTPASTTASISHFLDVTNGWLLDYFFYENRTSLTYGLANEVLDCDLYSILLMTAFEMHGLTLSAINIPGHMFVLWEGEEGEVVAWESTGNHPIKNKSFLRRAKEGSFYYFPQNSDMVKNNFNREIWVNLGAGKDNAAIDKKLMSVIDMSTHRDMELKAHIEKDEFLHQQILELYPENESSRMFLALAAKERGDKVSVSKYMDYKFSNITSNYICVKSNVLCNTYRVYSDLIDVVLSTNNTTMNKDWKMIFFLSNSLLLSLCLILTPTVFFLKSK